MILLGQYPSSLHYAESEYSLPKPADRFSRQQDAFFGKRVVDPYVQPLKPRHTKAGSLISGTSFQARLRPTCVWQRCSPRGVFWHETENAKRPCMSPFCIILGNCRPRSVITSEKLVVSALRSSFHLFQNDHAGDDKLQNNAP
ncbi:hypothetical protein CEXT_458481 [Caerostris extrusa]|uniref:Uncharacterized protein n=1 Tax=Caerostris extrusa TaxID=172846 RepID=A0AAV4W910_CAEEX|nr:hypothetical protein CEXT_458481 [Caerostris extrusa]